MNGRDLPPLREVIAKHGLDARKSFGQHFLLDGNLTDRIVRVAGDVTAATIIEVGPGPGGLTRSLLRGGAKSVIAIEKDKRAVAAVNDLKPFWPDRLTVVEADALTVDVADVAAPPRQIVANLPYNVATPLLILWLRQIAGVSRLTLMFQKEVADRLVAAPGEQAYGRLSVVAQWLCVTTREFNIDRLAFLPPPKVTSTVMTLVPRPLPIAPASFGALEAVTAAAFGQRRKMLRSSLRRLGLRPERIGIDPTRRAEELSVDEFCALARQLEGGAQSSAPDGAARLDGGTRPSGPLRTAATPRRSASSSK